MFRHLKNRHAHRWGIGWREQQEWWLVELGHFYIRILLEPRDLWIGVYWTFSRTQFRGGPDVTWLFVYICVLPCLPLKIGVLLDEKGGK